MTTSADTHDDGVVRDAGLLSEGMSRRQALARIGVGGAVIWASPVLSNVALAGPRWPDLRTRVPTEGIAIEVVIDVSGSMNERDFIWHDERVTRLEAARRVLRLFVNGGEAPGGERLPGRDNDLIGLITFSARPDVVCPLTLSHSVLLGALDAQEAQAEDTNIGDAIAWGLVRLESAGRRPKVMVLLSDGEHNVPPPAYKPRQAAQLAASQKVRIYAIDVGGAVGGNAEPGADRDGARQTLEAVAQITGGRYFPANDTASLLRVCQEIDRLERQPVESFQYRRYYEAYPWFGLASLVFLMTAGVLDLSFWRRLP